MDKKMNSVQNPHLLLISLGIPQDKKIRTFEQKTKKNKKLIFCVVVSTFRFTSTFTLHQKSNFWRPTDWSHFLNSTLPWCPSRRLIPLLNHPSTYFFTFQLSALLFEPSDRPNIIIIIYLLYCPFYLYHCSLLLERIFLTFCTAYLHTIPLSFTTHISSQHHIIP